MTTSKAIRLEQKKLKLEALKLAIQLIDDSIHKVKSPAMVAAISELIQSLIKL